MKLFIGLWSSLGKVFLSQINRVDTGGLSFQLYHTDAGGRSSQELFKLMNKVAGNREMFDENSTPGS